MPRVRGCSLCPYSAALVASPHSLCLGTNKLKGLTLRNCPHPSSAAIVSISLAFPISLGPPLAPGNRSRLCSPPSTDYTPPQTLSFPTHTARMNSSDQSVSRSPSSPAVCRGWLLARGVDMVASAASGGWRQAGRRRGTVLGQLFTTHLVVAVIAIAALLSGSGVQALNTLGDGTTVEGTHLIIGGSNTNASSFPYVALLQITTPVAGSTTVKSVTTCTGTLIQTNPVPVIVTAAHCASSGEEQYAKAYVGRENLAVQCSAESTCAEFSVTSIITHPAYNHSSGVDTTGHDVALWVLTASSSSKAGSVTPAVMNTDANFPTVGVSSTALGWGYTNLHGAAGTNATLASRLQSVGLTVVDTTNCESTYGLSPNYRPNFECLKGSVVNGIQTSTCQGDSGGPHIVNGKLHGITSFGPSPCDDGSPLVLVRLSGVAKWINGVFTTINAGGTYNGSSDVSVGVVNGNVGNQTILTQTTGNFWEWPDYSIGNASFVLKTAAAADSTEGCWSQCRNTSKCWWALFDSNAKSCTLYRPNFSSSNSTYFSIKFGESYYVFRGVDIPDYGVVSTNVYMANTDIVTGERNCREGCTRMGFNCHL
ncbi:trypsin-like serine protease [Gonapodya prolifera JEL478]|uniref:Trypsin-like serine protease n=1 Tax=Gonapodya prolifera (strain JEL478) TaxID=1344416 RepID=A0A139ACB7_GONPJ|nr:trypsin-like serine protease [Gonapodya prolifera JEL478]|eukprot:KXS14452.1 trypsin-like serine protease [Gonapodya prolifera JEL478]